jgi:hypothetical protein
VAWAQQANTGGTSWTGSASLNEAGTGYCTAITKDAAAPSAAEVKADNNANKQGTGGTVGMGTPATTYNCTVTGLTQLTAYDFYFVAEDGVPNLQAAVSGPVTATTADTTAPLTMGALAQNASTATTWTGQATISEAGTGYITAVTNGSGAPTAAAVKADNDPDKKGTGCSMTMIGGGVKTCQVTGLTTGTTYDFYFVAQDSAGNLQSDASVTTVNATTP